MKLRQTSNQRTLLLNPRQNMNHLTPRIWEGKDENIKGKLLATRKK